MLALRAEGEPGGWRLDYHGKGALLDVFTEVADPWTLESSRSGDGFSLTLYSASGARIGAQGASGRDADGGDRQGRVRSADRLAVNTLHHKKRVTKENFLGNNSALPESPL